MNYFIFTILFLSATLTEPTISPNSTNLELTCEKVADLTPSTAVEIYSFCITSLQVISGSQSADRRGLTVIACKLTKASYTNNLNLILELLASRGESDPARPALEACLARYGAGIEYLQAGLMSIESGEFNGALFSLHEAWKRALACDEDLKSVNGGGGGGEGASMGKENSDALGLVDVVIKLTLLLQL